MKIYLLGTLLLLCAIPLAAQTTQGRVYEIDEQGSKLPVAGAIIEWLGSETAVVSDSEGQFTIAQRPAGEQLRASFIGYQADTITYQEGAPIELLLRIDPQAIEQVTVRGRASNIVSSSAIEKQEQITFAGLCKMACCNLAESFENSASVTVGYSDAVTGARQIKLLGYSGTYTQMLDEARPIMRGLAAPYGLEYTPGMWLQGIQISKGVTSVTSGYEALTGQINLEHRKPTDNEPLFVNLYLGEDLRTEANITSSFFLTEQLSTVILSHVSVDNHEMDKNSDGFLDTPLKKQYNLANRWLYTAKSGAQVRFGIKGLYETRTGGELGFEQSDLLDYSAYGSEIENKHFNSYLKVGIPVITGSVQFVEGGMKDPTTSNIALVVDYLYHEQDAYFGIKDYAGAQNSLFANLLYQINYGTKHQLTIGSSLTSDHYDEGLLDRFFSPDRVLNINYHDFDRTLTTAGLFTEYSLQLKEQLSVVAGLRSDHNNRYGWLFTPRAHVKWGLTPTTTLRGSAGVGYRISSLLSDNIGMLATGREMAFDEGLNPMERGVTAGVSLTQRFTVGGGDGSASVEYFRSEFTDQVIVDQESDPTAVLFYNLDGVSYTDTYQVDLSYAPIAPLTFYATFRYNDARTTLRGGEVIETPLVSQYKGVFNVQYATRFDR